MLIHTQMQAHGTQHCVIECLGAHSSKVTASITVRDFTEVPARSGWRGGVPEAGAGAVLLRVRVPDVVVTHAAFLWPELALSLGGA